MVLVEMLRSKTGRRAADPVLPSAGLWRINEATLTFVWSEGGAAANVRHVWFRKRRRANWKQTSYLSATSKTSQLDHLWEMNGERKRRKMLTVLLLFEGKQLMGHVTQVLAASEKVFLSVLFP